MIEWFKSAPESSRHERMLWAVRKVAHLTGVSEGRAYQMLLIALIEAEGPTNLNVNADEYLDVSVSRGSQQRQVREPFNDANDVIIITTPLRLSKKLRSLPSSLRGNNSN